MKISEIKMLTNAELKVKLADAQQELMNLRFQITTGQQTDTSRLKITRRLIARFETVMREKELEEVKEGAK